MPFLTNFPLADFHGAYRRAREGFAALTDERDGWRALGWFDTLSHAHRLDVPVMLTSGSEDTSTPPATIESLFEKLPGTKSYTRLHGSRHRYSYEFIHLVTAWFRLYA